MDHPPSKGGGGKNATSSCVLERRRQKGTVAKERNGESIWLRRFACHKVKGASSLTSSDTLGGTSVILPAAG